MADEIEMRRRADALLAELKTTAAKSKSKPKRKFTEQLDLTRLHNRQAKARLDRHHKTDKPKVAKAGSGRHKAKQGWPLCDRLLARTESHLWYSHAQLQKLLPETNKNGLHAIIYQKMPRKGLIERRALMAHPQTPWLGQEGVAAFRAGLVPRYLYRIGAEAGEARRVARLKGEMVSGYGFE